MHSSPVDPSPLGGLHSDPRAANGVVAADLTPVAGPHGIRGIGRYVGGIVAALLHEQSAWCADHLGLLITDEQDAPSGVRAAWRTSRAPWRSQDVGWAWAMVADRLAVRSRRPSVWHLTDPAAPMAPLPLDRTIATVYDLIPLLEPLVMARIRTHRRAIYRRYLHVVGRAKLIVAISKTTAQDVHELLQIPMDRIVVVHPWVTRPGGRASEPGGPVGGHVWSRSLGDSGVGLPAARPSFLFVGVPDPHKRADLAIQALAVYRRQERGATLTFIGHHPPAVREELDRLAVRLHVRDAITFIDRLDDDALAQRYERNILLAISSREGFGLPPVEALLSGGRVVATPTPIYREVLGDAAVYAADATAEELALAMAETIDRPPPSDATQDDLARRYSAQHSAAALLDAYRRLLDGSE